MTMTYQGETKVIKVSEDTCILEAAEKEFDAPNSCRNGICTTCAGRVKAGDKSSYKVGMGVRSRYIYTFIISPNQYTHRRLSMGYHQSNLRMVSS